MSEELRVLLIDDHVLCQRGLTDLLHHRGGIRVVGATSNGNEASRLITELAPLHPRHDTFPGEVSSALLPTRWTGA